MLGKVLLATGLALIGAPALATTVTVDLTGRVTSDISDAPYGNPYDEVVEVSFVYDTSVGTLSTYPGGQSLSGPVTTTVIFRGFETTYLTDTGFVSVFNDPGPEADGGIYGESNYFGSGAGVHCIDDSDEIADRLDEAYSGASLCSGTFLFGDTTLNATFSGIEFTIVATPVPLPAAGILLAGALLVLGRSKGKMPIRKNRD